MILLVDNYDSFTYNLVQRLGEIDAQVDLKVVRNDQCTRRRHRARGAQPPDHLPGSVHAG